MAPTLPALTPPPPEHSTSTEPSSAAKRASTSPTALSTKSHKAPLERKKRKTPPPPPPPELTPAKTSDATEPASKKKLVLAAPCHAGGGGQSSKGATQEKSAGHQSGKDALAHKSKTLDEMRELYPHLIDEAMALVDPAVLERVLPRIDDNKAQALDKKIKKARRQLTKAITESVSKPFLSLIIKVGSTISL
jgi:type IV secretory pathway VirB10-like protein